MVTKRKACQDKFIVEGTRRIEGEQTDTSTNSQRLEDTEPVTVSTKPARRSSIDW